MARITGPGLGWLDDRADELAALVEDQVRGVCEDLAAHLTADSDEHDAGAVYGLWQKAVDDRIMPALRGVWDDATGHVRDQVAAAAKRALDALTAASEVEIGPVTDEITQAYLETATNRMVAVTDILWQAVREALLAGLQVGEGVAELAARVIAATEVINPRATVVARTEVVGAANAGALAQVQHLGLPARKQWVATHDPRTRPHHEEADGQTVDLRAAFTVGGYPMQRPHDVGAPAGEVVNCRCTLSFEIADEDLVTDRPSLAAAANAGHTGAMVALIPSAADLERLLVEGGEPAEELHCTLAFLGEAADWTEDQRRELTLAVAAVTDMVDGPLEGRGFHIAHFNPGGQEPCWVLGVGGEDLATFHALTWDALEGLSSTPEIPEQHAPWSPHVTLAYTDDAAAGADLMDRAGPVAFDTLRVAFGDDVVDLPMGGATLAAAGPAMEGGHTVTETDTRTEAPQAAESAEMAEMAREAEGYESPRGEVESPAETEMKTAGWSGVLVVEGVTTGDGREFAPDGLTWPDPATVVIPLRWNIEDSHGGEARTKAVLVGRIDRIWRDGPLLMGEGRIDLGGANGREAYRLLDAEFLAGVSIDADDIADADIEFIWPEDAEQDDEDAMPMGPEKILFKGGRIRGATLCDIPAFVEAWVKLDRREAVTATAGQDGAEATTGGDDQGLLLTAAAAADEQYPPPGWFQNPGLPVPIGITVTDEGRVYGHAALWGVCHVGYEDQCVTAPQEPSHDYFLTGEVVCSDGSRAPVGQITLGTGHAPLYMGARAAAEHYDNTGAVVADVTVGNDEHGIWVAGQIRPGTDPQRVRALQASGQLSGDWRRIGGQLRLVGLLAVNVPGFGVPRLATRVASGVQQALVAAGIPSVGRGSPALSPEDLEQVKLRAVLEHLGARVHSGAPDPVAATRAELRSRVHNGV